MSHREFGGAKGEHFVRVNVECDNNYENRFSKLINDYENTDVYRSVYEYANEDVTECTLYGDFYLDFDGKPTEMADTKRQAVQVALLLRDKLKIPEYGILCYFSGSKGFHIVVLAEVLGIEPCVNLNIRFKKFMEWLTLLVPCPSIDRKIYDRRRVFRIPNSINRKSGLYKVQLTIDELWHKKPEEIIKIAANPRGTLVLEKKDPEVFLFPELFDGDLREESTREAKPFIPPADKKPFLPCVYAAINTPVTEGSRNNTGVAIANVLYQSGYNFEETLDVIIDWNRENTPPMKTDEVVALTQSASVILQQGKQYGCSTFNELGFCVGPRCHLYNRRQ